jgi:cell wall-associated NlpC family hydrolase
MGRINPQAFEGIDFEMERQNCYQLVRRVYKESYGIELPDVPSPTDWWERGFSLFSEHADTFGFDPVHSHPRDWQEGDVLVIAVASSVGNHTAVLLDTGEILHHLVGQRSCVTSFGGMFRNGLVGVYRHRDVKPIPPSEVQTVELKDLLPRHVRRRLEIAAAAQGVEF